MLTLQHNITADFLAKLFDVMDFMERGTAFKKKIPNVGTVFCQRWRNTKEWCLSLYSEDDRQMQVFVETVSEFWMALTLFHVKQHIKKN